MHPLDLPSHRLILRLHQTPGGGFVASLDYPPYHKVWIRDHAFVTWVLQDLHWDDLGQPAVAFLDRWLLQEIPKLQTLLTLTPGDPSFLDLAHHPRARYFPDLRPVPGPWLERQYDGSGLALAVLARAWPELRPESREALKLLAQALIHVSRTPCADLWEMHDAWLHAETIGAIVFGLNEVSKIWPEFREPVQELRGWLREQFVYQGILRKMRKPQGEGPPIGLDAAVLLIWTWFGGLPSVDTQDILQHTLEALYAHLSPDGVRLRRYVIPELKEHDTYFGGSPWVITTLWAVQAYLLLGDRNRAEAIFQRIAQDFPLPEQWPEDAQDPAALEEWHRRAEQETHGQTLGPPKILAWSHTEFLRTARLLGKI